MNRVVIVVVVLLVLGAAVYFGPGLATTYAKNKALNRCAELKAALALEQRQGGDVNRAVALQQQIQQCDAEANSLGAAIDPALEALHAAESSEGQINQEFSHLRSTDYSDTVKRGNTRGTMLRLGENMIGQFSAAIEQAGTNKATLEAIRTAMVRAGREARARQQCYYYGSSGCDRFAGSTETAGNDKAAEEKSRVVDPLWQLLATLDTRLAQLDSHYAAEAAALAANPSPPANGLFGA